MDSTKKSEKTRQPITVAMKKEIIKKYEEGATITQFCRLYDRNKSTTGTIIKDKDKFKAATAPQGITKLVKTRKRIEAEEAEKGDQGDQIDPDDPPVSSTTKSGGHF